MLQVTSLFYKDFPTLAYTHLQPAQLTTIGKRFTIWNSDVYIDLTNINDTINLINKINF